jgi:hypothetical protein
MSLGGQIKKHLTVLKVHFFLTPLKYSMKKLQKKSSVWVKVKNAHLRVHVQISKYDDKKN